MLHTDKKTHLLTASLQHPELVIADNKLPMHTTVLIGDSILKNIQGPKLAKEVGARV